MFRRLRDDAERVTILVDGRRVGAVAGESVAAALLAEGIERTRVTDARGAPRGPHCAIGACFDCLVTIDGVGNRRACMVEVAPGMSVETQGSKRELTR
jgi:predicted molibdopterin-dependent oxidoreductase YjgC